LAHGRKTLEILASKRFKATVFAPTNYAFAAFKNKTGVDLRNPLVLATLTALVPSAIPDVLMYHVVPRVKLALADLKNGSSLETLYGAGSPLRISTGTTSGADGQIWYAGEGAESSAHIVKAISDLKAGNGYVHAIDYILLGRPVPL
jgi:uncharacterized surface protein with fasciclin (FAS1) repeats